MKTFTTSQKLMILFYSVFTAMHIVLLVIVPILFVKIALSIFVGAYAMQLIINIVSVLPKYRIQVQTDVGNKIKALIDDFNLIENCNDLIKRNLSLYGYNNFNRIIKELFHEKQSFFIDESIKNYIESFDIKCIQTKNGWIVKI